MTVPAMKAGLRIAVVGVSSLIGEAVIDELRARKIAFAELHALDDGGSSTVPPRSGRARMCRWWRRMSTPTLWMPSAHRV